MMLTKDWYGNYTPEYRFNPPEPWEEMEPDEEFDTDWLEWEPEEGDEE